MLRGCKLSHGAPGVVSLHGSSMPSPPRLTNPRQQLLYMDAVYGTLVEELSNRWGGFGDLLYMGAVFGVLVEELSLGPVGGGRAEVGPGGLGRLESGGRGSGGKGGFGGKG